MTGSRTGSSDLTYSSLRDEVPVVSVPFESSGVQGINIKESSGESSEERVGSMVGWIVHKRYGIHEVKGVVQSYNSETKIYEVRYKDGKSEKVTEDSLVRYLSPCSPEDEKQSQKAKPAIMNASNAGHTVPARKATKRKSTGTATAKQSKKVSQGSGEVTAANSSKRAGTATAKQSRKVSQGSGEVTAANSSKRAGTATAKQSRKVSQGSGEVTAANSSKRVSSGKKAGTATAKQSRKVSQGSDEVTAANSSKRAGTAAAQQSRQVSQGSSEVPAANSSNVGKSRYRSLRMNAGP